MQATRLRPQTVPELLDRAFRIYREAFLPCVALVAVVTIPLTILSYALSRSYEDQMTQVLLNLQRTTRYSDYGGGYSSYSLSLMQNQLYGALLGIMLISGLIFLAQTILINGPLTYMTSERLAGNNVTIIEALRATMGQAGRLIGGMVFLLIIMAVLIIGLVFAVAFTCGIGIFVAIPFAVFVSLSLYAFIIPCILLERIPVMQAVRRGWDLAKGRFWQVFFVIFAIAIISGAVNLALGIVQQAITPNPTPTLASLRGGLSVADMISLIIQTGVGIILLPVLPVALTVLYYDARIKLERFDLALIALDRPNGRASDVPVPPSTGPLFTNKDMSALVILSGLFFLIIIAFYAVAILTVTRLAGF